MVRCLMFVSLAAAAWPAAAPAQPVAIHYVNDSGVSADAALTAPGATFVTDYRSPGDTTITLLATNTLGVHYNLSYTTANSPTTNDNPGYVTGFQGSMANGTGNGTVGNISGLLTQSGGGTKIQVDFAHRIGLADHILFTDIDGSETVSVQAFTLSGGTYTPVSLAGWDPESYTGATGHMPDATWATWSATGGGPTTGTWTGHTHDNLDSPLNVLTPDQPIDRLVFSQDVSSGSVLFQVVGVPEPAGGALTLAAAGLGLLGRAVRKALRPRNAAPPV